MAFDTATIESLYTAAIAATTLLDDIEKEQAKALLSRLVAAMALANTAASNDVMSYSIAGRSVTRRDPSSGMGSASNSVASLQRKLDLMIGRRNLTMLSNLGGYTDGN